MKLNNTFNTRNIKDYKFENYKYRYSFSDLVFEIMEINIEDISVRLHEECNIDDMIVCQDFVIQVKDKDLKRLMERYKKYFEATDTRYLDMRNKMVDIIVKDRNVLKLFNIYDTYLQIKKEIGEQFFAIEVTI
jgi:hypothetical protein